MRVGRQNVPQPCHLHFPHSLPVTLLWMDCSLLHFRPLPMSAERRGIRKFPVMPYSVSQRRSPIHAHGMRQRRAKAEHSRPNTSKYNGLKPVWEWVWMKALVHARVSHVYLCFQVGHFYLENPSIYMKPQAWKASGSRRIPGGVRTFVSTLILTLYRETHINIEHEGIYKLSVNERDMG